MLTTKITDSIKDFVRQEPRTTDDIAKKLRISWVTADRYVQRISDEDGSIKVKTFRGGTRGALKLVYWNNTDKPAMSSVQDKLFQMILRGRTKYDFSPLDIYQYVDDKKRSAEVEREPHESTRMPTYLWELLERTKTQLLIFSGNLSWSNFKLNDATFLDLIETLAKRGASIKILTRVDLAGIDNIHRMLAINQRLGKDAIQIRHCEQPLRAFIIDDQVLRLKEIKQPRDYKPGELQAVTNIYYTITDKDWVAWMQKVFWHNYAQAVDAQTRINVLKSIKA